MVGWLPACSEGTARLHQLMQLRPKSALKLLLNTSRSRTPESHRSTEQKIQRWTLPRAREHNKRKHARIYRENPEAFQSRTTKITPPKNEHPRAKRSPLPSCRGLTSRTRSFFGSKKGAPRHGGSMVELVGIIFPPPPCFRVEGRRLTAV